VIRFIVFIQDVVLVRVSYMLDKKKRHHVLLQQLGQWDDVDRGFHHGQCRHC
jgi:hypothetical protein